MKKLKPVKRKSFGLASTLADIAAVGAFIASFATMFFLSKQVENSKTSTQKFNKAIEEEVDGTNPETTRFHEWNDELPLKSTRTTPARKGREVR